MGNSEGARASGPTQAPQSDACGLSGERLITQFEMTCQGKHGAGMAQFDSTHEAADCQQTFRGLTTSAVLSPTGRCSISPDADEHVS